MNQRLSKPLSAEAVIRNCFDSNKKRQSIFAKDLIRTHRKHSRLIRKTTENIRNLKHQDKTKFEQENRRNLFTTPMIGETPPRWSLRLAPRDKDLPPMQQKDEYSKVWTPNPVPTRRFSNPEFFEENCLSPTGKRAIVEVPPLPKNWVEMTIEHVEDTPVEYAPTLEPQYQITVDEGRVYYYNNKSGAVSFIPPPGSSPLAFEAFKNYGRIG